VSYSTRLVTAPRRERLSSHAHRCDGGFTSACYADERARLGRGRRGKVRAMAAAPRATAA